MSNFFTLDDDVMVATTEDRILFRSATEFSMFITNTAHKNGDTLTATILAYCDDRDIDPEGIAKLISKPLKDLIEIEMQEAGLLPKQTNATLDL